MGVVCFVVLPVKLNAMCVTCVWYGMGCGVHVQPLLLEYECDVQS